MMIRQWFAFFGMALVCFMAAEAHADNAVTSGEKTMPEKPTAPAVVNWQTPSKRDLVERALSDGMTDPAQIVEWAKNHKVAMTTQEVQNLEAELKK